MVTKERKVQFLSYIAVQKGLKLSIIGIYPLLLQSQTRKLTSNRAKLLVALFLEVW